MSTVLLTYTPSDALFEEVQNALEPEGYVIRRSPTFEDSVQTLGTTEPAALLLDIGGHPDPVSAVQALRAISSCPIVVLSDPEDSTTAIDLVDVGADDFLCQNLVTAGERGQRELRVRLASSLRTSAYGADPRGSIVVGDVVIDSARNRVMVGNETLVMTGIEYRLLRFFAGRIGEVVPHEEVLAEVWSDAHRHKSEYLRTYVSRLRKKLGWDISDRKGPELRAVRGTGYGLFLSEGA